MADELLSNLALPGSKGALPLTLCGLWREGGKALNHPSRRIDRSTGADKLAIVPTWPKMDRAWNELFEIVDAIEEASLCSLWHDDDPPVSKS
jgi:hypothetical protein